MLTLSNFEAGAKGQIQHLKRFQGHNFQQVVFTFQNPSSKDKVFLIEQPHFTLNM